VLSAALRFNITFTGNSSSGKRAVLDELIVMSAARTTEKGRNKMRMVNSRTVFINSKTLIY
jgi:hypothetical protein